MTKNQSADAQRSPIRVAYSFPHRIGAGRICHTAWQQVNGISKAGCQVNLMTGSIATPLPDSVKIKQTLSIKKARIPVRLIGRTLACSIHDKRTARWLRRNAKTVDLVHCWPMGSLATLREAKKLGIPSLLERPNAHTKFAFEVVKEENQIVGIQLPGTHDHTYNSSTLKTELQEYETADYLLCPSEFVKNSFIEEGYPEKRLVRHQYGCDLEHFIPSQTKPSVPFQAIYAGVCEPRKGLHYALRAWRASKASDIGKFIICGSFVPGYKEKLSDLMDHPSIQYLGHRTDLPDLMRKSNIFILSSVEEGSALVSYEARASGCILLVSESTGAIGEHQKNALLHKSRDWESLTQHIDDVFLSKQHQENLRKSSLKGRDQLSWNFAGTRLAAIYQRLIK